MNVSSHGDLLPGGTFAVHSTFRRCVNFTGPGGLVSVVDGTIGPGPFHVVLAPDVQGPVVLPTASLVLVLSREGGRAVLDGSGLALDPALRYDSSLGLGPTVDPDVICLGAGRLERIVLAEARPGSLAFLLDLDDAERRVHLGTAFERAFAEHMVGVLELLRTGALSEAAGGARGAGMGLTPAGDDFVCGLLIASHVVQAVGGGIDGRIRGRDLAVDREALYLASLGGNMLSNTFLGAAREGRLNAPARGVARALCVDDLAALEGAAQALLAQGETSGSDTAVGIVIGTKYWLGI